METMKEHFKQAFLLAFGNSSVTPQTLAVLIKVFAMGWRESLLAKSLNDDALTAISECSMFHEENWSPDESWHWWS